MISTDTLLAKLDQAPAAKKRGVGFNALPEDRGNSMRMRVRRLFKYRGAYARHIWQHLQESIRRLSKKDLHAKTFWGRELRLPNRDSNARSIVETGTLGPNENGLTRFFIRTLRSDDVFYDIGANYGFYTALAQECITNGEVHAFEPGRSVFAYVQQLGRSRTFLNNTAVSNSNGDVQFFDSYASNSSGKSTLSPNIASSSLGYYKTSTIQSVTLDTYCNTHTAPTILKIDVEGAEPDVLAGGTQLFAKHSPVVAVELWSGEELYEYSLKTMNKFKELNYSPFFIEDSGDLRPTSYEFLEGWLRTKQPDANMVFKR